MENEKSKTSHENGKLSLIAKSPTRRENIEVSVDTTISNVKELIANKFNVDVPSLRLIYAGRILKDADTIQSLNIKDGYTIYVAIKPSGQTTNSLSNNDSVPMNSSIENPLARNILQQYANTPDVLRSLLNNNSALQQVIQRNPDVGHIINNPTLLREAMAIMRNPNIANEFIRSADRAMNNIESLPGGFNALQQMYHDIEEPLINATNETVNPFANLFPSTISSNQQGTENREPLPNPWTLIDPHNERSSSRLANPSVENMLQQVQTYLAESENLTSPQMLEDVQSLLANSQIHHPDEISNLQQQLNDTIAQMISQNVNLQQTENVNNLSPEVISAIILHALLFANIIRNQSPYVSNNNVTNSNNVAQLFSQLNIQGNSNVAGHFEEHYRPQMQQLTEMGFANQEANLQALIACFGDLNRAIDMLLSRNLMN